jgi:aspartyl protease family protein
MIRDNSGIYQIPILVNGVKMYFVFDTGASLISISNVEAIFLYKQGKLTKEDILGNQKFSDANGDISVGTIINLKEISIGKRILYNVKATVVDNSNAPLLFGQSALAQFGKISIDYKKQVLVFE